MLAPQLLHTCFDTPQASALTMAAVSTFFNFLVIFYHMTQCALLLRSTVAIRLF
jgi:hypothetical protein